MQKRIVFIIILFLLFTGGTFFAMQNKDTSVTKEKDIAGATIKKTAESAAADVESKDEEPSSQLIATAKSLIACFGPDGKTAQASQADCDNLWKFWNAQPKNAQVVNTSTITSNTTSNNNSSTTPTSTVTPTQSPTVTPTITVTLTPTPTETQQILPAIDSIDVMECGSSSCGHITTLQINGSNFTPDTIVQLVGLGWGAVSIALATSISHSRTALLRGRWLSPCCSCHRGETGASTATA